MSKKEYSHGPYAFGIELYMVKVMGQVCEIALCLEDEDNSIRDLARLLLVN